MPPAISRRLLLFVLAVALGGLLILWLQTRIATQLDRLEREFSVLKAETFSVAVEFRNQFRNLNFTLLDAHLSPDGASPTTYLAEASQLQDWLSKRRSDLLSATERGLLDVVARRFETYQTNAQRLLNVPQAGGRRADFANTYESVRDLSAPVMGAIADLAPAQHTAFDRFLADSGLILAALDRLLHLSVVLLVAAAGLLAVLVYRGMIAPLRRRLSESETLILRQEKLAALGTLAAGVAHEIRNPLTAIKFRLFSFKRALPPPLASHEDLPVISSEINRLDRIVKDFLQFARPAEPELADVPTQRLLQDVVDLLAPELRKASISLRLEPREPLILRADPHQLRQVLINLVQNAADSIGRNGAITLGARTATATLAGSSRTVVVLSVTDTGNGIPPEVEKRLFDPFFTTKEKGTGLGLPIAARIVEKHGGILRYRTEARRGTTFEIVLPHPDAHATQTPDH